MRLNLKRSATRMAITTTLALGLLAGSAAVYAQGFRRYDSRVESPAGRTTHDLEMLARHTSPFDSGRERGRYDVAIRHLSQFQNRLDRGHFDKGRLDEAISDVQHVIDHNPLDSRARGMLWRDLQDLRAFRSSRGYGFERPYGYR
jgi:hypothetical protein